MKNTIAFLFSVLVTIIPVIFFWKSSEVFEFNKMIVVYFATIFITTSWIVRMIAEKRLIFKRTILDIPLVLFLVSNILSTTFSIDPRTSIFGYYSRFHGGLLSTISYLLLYWSFVANIDNKQTSKIIKYFTYSSVFVAIWAAMEHFGASPSCLLITQEFNTGCWVQYERGAERVFATMGQPNWLAALLVAIMPFTWSSTHIKSTSEKNISKYAWLFASLTLFTALLFTRSRSGIIAYGITTLIYICFIFAKEKFHLTSRIKTFLFLNFLATLILLIVGSPWTPSLSQMIKIQPQAKQTSIQTGTVLDSGGTESGDIRKIVWEGAFNLWRKYPIFGSGVETFAYGYYETRPQKHNETSEWDYLYNKAHNEYLNVLATTGIVGIISYIVLIFAIFVQIVNIKVLNFESAIKLFFSGKIANENILILTSFVSLLITNFFGFSVVATGLLFFLLPAFSQGFKNEEGKIKKIFNLTDLQKGCIALTLIAGITVSIVLCRYWQADFLYAQSKSTTEKNFKIILENAEKAIQLSPQEPLYRDHLSSLYASFAVALDEAGAPEKAREYAQLSHSESNLSFSLSPRNVTIQRSRANILTEMGGIDSLYLIEATKTYDYILKYAPTDAKAYYKAGLSYFRVGQSEKARQLMQQAIELKPNYKDAQRDLNKI